MYYVLVARLNGNTEDYVAAQQIAISLTSLIFIIPQSLGISTTVRVGYSLGCEEFNRARYISGVSIATAILISIVTAIFLVAFRYPLVSMYTDDMAVIGIAGSVIFICRCFSIGRCHTMCCKLCFAWL